MAAEAKQSITKRDLAVAIRYTHMIDRASLVVELEQTVCGLLPAYGVAGGAEDDEIGIPIACDCGHEECGNKPTCPICISISSGVVN